MVSLSSASRLVHAVALYGSDDEFLDSVVPFCEAGVEAGEPTIVGLGGRTGALLRSEFDGADELVFVSNSERYRHAPGALASTFDLVHAYAGGGTESVRMIGELPRRTGLSLDAWLRYEAAVNRFLSDLPLQALCTYDTRHTAATVQTELLRTHHAVARGEDSYEESSRYEPPEAFMAGRVHVAQDPLEDGPADVELVDPAPSMVRQVVTALAAEQQLESSATGDLLVGVSEVLANAIRHGSDPIVVRGWGAPGRVVVSVQDSGDGPDDPFAGFHPVEPGASIGGLGLWITHQLCPEVALDVNADGFTVRLGAGNPAHTAPS